MRSVDKQGVEVVEKKKFEIPLLLTERSSISSARSATTSQAVTTRQKLKIFQDSEGSEIREE